MMTPQCHYNPTLKYRTTPGHRDDCTSPHTHDACIPCTAPHCVICNTRHATNEQPQTCPPCEGKVWEDLETLRTAPQALHTEATDAARDGHLAAAAPIPGGTAQVLLGPTVQPDTVIYSRTRLADHHPKDPIPPLAVLAYWEDTYADWLGHTRTGRATIDRAAGYLQGLLPVIAQAADGPDFARFARDVRVLRAQCERALHNERSPEIGVACFECGEELVRRFREPARCKHSTPARRRLQAALSGGERPAVRLLEVLVREARRPCGRCNQGGLDDPRAGLSWECPGCRKEYDPGEYATAVRRDLLDRQMGGEGWTHLSMAVDAASTLTGFVVSSGTVRKWAERGKVASCCLWVPGRSWGVRLVFWPDVAEEAVLAVDRMLLARSRRRERERGRRVAAQGV